jgi:hypothetical protein
MEGGVTINTRDASQFAEIDEFASMNNGAPPDATLIVGLYTEMDTNRGRVICCMATHSYRST